MSEGECILWGLPGKGVSSFTSLLTGDIRSTEGVLTVRHLFVSRHLRGFNTPSTKDYTENGTFACLSATDPKGTMKLDLNINNWTEPHGLNNWTVNGKPMNIG